MVRIVSWLLVIALILTQAVMWKYTGALTHPQIYKYIVILICGVGILCLGSFSKDNIIAAFIIAAYFAVFLIFNHVSADRLILVVMAPSIAMFVLFREMESRGYLHCLFDAYTDLLFIIALVSVIFWLTGSVLGIMPGRVLLHYEWADHSFNTYSYFGIYFENPVQATHLLGHELVRNTGICTEAPGYCDILFYALTLEVFYYKKRNVRKWTLIIALLTTMSTKAFGVLLILFIYYFLKKIYVETRYGVKAFFMAFIPVALIVVVAAGIVLMAGKSDTGSFRIRMDDFRSGLLAWRRNILFGAGYTDSVITRYFRVHRPNNGLSMGITVILGKGGLYLFMYYLLPHILFLRRAVRSGKSLAEPVFIILLLAFEIFISNNGENILYLAVIAVLYTLSLNYEEGITNEQ